MARQPRARTAAAAAPTATATSTATGAARATIADRELIARQRTPLTADLLGATQGKQEQAFLEIRQAGISNLFRGMQEVHASLGVLSAELVDRAAPAQLIGTLVQPDGSAARLVQVEFDPDTLGRKGPAVTTLTADDGSFHLTLPSGLRFATGGSLALAIHGGNSNLALTLPFASIASNGLAGSIALPQHVAPLPVSILASLLAVAPPPLENAPDPAPDSTPQLPTVKVGDCDECLLQFGSNRSIDKFPYGIFFRLVEPRASVTTAVRRFGVADGAFGFLTYYQNAATAAGDQVSFVDRVPVDQPLSVDGFRDRVMGLQPNGTFTADETVPMAGTLGLGYVLRMSQRWTFQGLALGDLVYSLPLAPGEQQQVAIFERRDTSSVFESEFFDESQALRQQATADTSTDATFAAAFNEVINGRSSFKTDSDTSSVGGSFFGLISGGSGSSSSSGTTSSSLQGQRDTTQHATEATHSAAQNSASARRTASRTGMRIANAGESQSVTTKTITNHNHTRALTMQYWEVLRLYDVTTAIDGLTMTVLVPLQVIRFMPPGQPLTITSATQVDTRAELLVRYNAIIKHADVLAATLPRQYRHGLAMLTQFAADPTATVEPAGGVAEDVIDLRLTGQFTPYDVITVTAVTNRNTRVGPVTLANTAANPPAETFSTRDEFVAWLHDQRNFGSFAFTGALALPPSMNRSSIIGFEITRRFKPATYSLISKEQAELNALNAKFGNSSSWLTQAIEATLGQAAAAAPRVTVTLDAGTLEREIGGPRVSQFRARIVEFDGSGNPVGAPGESYANDQLGGVELPPDPYPIPALQLGPVLRFKEILEIEKMAQHVVRNTLRYSVNVWRSLSDVERAILLEGYTIGVPAGGVQDASQMVPLLNCVENRVLGFFGNSMILPFVIPQALAESAGRDGQGIDPGAIHESLLAYQRASFKPPRSTIALPTHGVLGEAVLGRCSSAEKIDLTRFWNWQDSPADTAPTISPVTLPTDSAALTAGLTAPNSLTNLPSLINNVLTAPAPDSALLQALGANAAAQKDFDSSLTNAKLLSDQITNAQTVSNSARADALKTSKDLQSQVIATAGNIVGGIYGGNPNAGSNAASAVNGQGPGTTPTPAAKTDGKTDGKADGKGSTGTIGGGTTGGGTTGGGTTGGGTTGGGTTGGGTTGGTGGGTTTPAPVPSPGPAPVDPGDA